MDISETGICKANYQGAACASCSAKNAKFGCRKVVDVIFVNVLAGQICFDCTTNELYYLRFAAYLGIQIVVIIFTTKYTTAFIKIPTLFRIEHTWQLHNLRILTGKETYRSPHY